MQTSVRVTVTLRSVQWSADWAGLCKRAAVLSLLRVCADVLRARATERGERPRHETARAVRREA